MEVCDGFLNNESLAQMTLREDAVGVGGNGMEQNTSRALARVHQRGPSAWIGAKCKSQITFTTW